MITTGGNKIVEKINVLKNSQGSPEQSEPPGGSGEVSEGVAMNSSTQDHN